MKRKKKLQRQKKCELGELCHAYSMDWTKWLNKSDLQKIVAFT